MDKELLVTTAQELTRKLDTTKVKPRAVMWVLEPETSNWKLWVVPDASVTDKREFYRIVAQCITGDAKLQGLDVGSTEYVAEGHPAVQGLRTILKMPGIGSANFSGNKFKDYFMPEGIIIRMDL